MKLPLDFKAEISIAHNDYRNSMVFHNVIDVQASCFLPAPASW